MAAYLPIQAAVDMAWSVEAWVWAGGAVVLICIAASLARRTFSARSAGGMVLSVSLAGGGEIVARIRDDLSALSAICMVSAGLSFGWSVAACLVSRMLERRSRPGVRLFDRVLTGMRVGAVACGILSGVLLVTLSCAHLAGWIAGWLMSGVPVLPPPWEVSPWAAGGTALVLLLALIAAGCDRTIAASRNVFWCLGFWLVIVAVSWPILSMDLRSADAGMGGVVSPAPTAWVWQAAVGAIVFVFVLADGIVRRRRKWQYVQSAPGALADAPRPNQGLYLSCAAVGLGIIISATIVLTDPQALSGYGRLMLFSQMIVLLIAGASILMMTHHAFSAATADVGLALITLGIVSFFAAAAPGTAPTAAEAYPLVFNAMMAGFGLACWLWTWLANVWEQQLLDGIAWTTAGRMIPFARQFSFLAGCLALLQAGLMALWPRFPAVAAADDSLGRFAAGVGTHLGLALVFCWCARHGRRAAFHVLALWTVLSLLLFMAARMLVFASSRH